MTARYTNKSGNDGNTGNSDLNAKLTIGAWAGLMSPSDTLNVGPGTYAESLLSTNGNLIPSGTAGNPTRVIGNNGVRGAVFMAPTHLQGANIDLRGTMSYIDFIGIGGDGSNWGSGVWPGNGPSIGGATNANSIHHVRIVSGEFKNNRCGSFGLNKCSDIVFGSNWIHDDSCTSFSHGYYIGDNTERVYVEDAITEDQVDYGLQLYTDGLSGPYPLDCVIRNSIWRFNGSAAQGGSGLSLGGINTLAYNNICHGNYESGIRIQYANATNVQVYNNTCWGNGDRGIWNVTGANSIIRNNISYGNLGNDNILDDVGNATIDHNLTSNPSLMNPASYDFRLTALSTNAINQGAIIGAFSGDFNGQSRTGNYDIGAYEYIVTSDATRLVLVTR